MAQSAPDELELPPGAEKGAVRDNLEVVCFALALLIFFKTFVGQQFKIPSASMRNTLMIGDHLLVNKFIFARPQWAWEEKLFPMRSVAKGDIIVFRYPLDRDQDYVKRCVALPGDTLEMKGGRLFVNGALVTGPWEHHRFQDTEGNPTEPIAGPWPLGREMKAGPEGRPRNAEPDSPTWPFLDPVVLRADRQGFTETVDGFRDILPPLKVPEGFVFAMGDNRDNSMDSRYWGFVPMDHLRGRPFIVWWSFREGENDDKPGRVPHSPGDIARDLGDTLRYFFVRTRWDRTGTIPR